MRRPGRITLALVTPILAQGGAAFASTVAPMTLPEIADHAAQVIVGRVTATESYWRTNPRTIESTVTFEQVEYLKGAWPAGGETFTLTVPGGTVGDTQFRIAHAPQFALGQKWLLFLLPSYRTFPTVGLAHGAILVQDDADGVERVYSAAGAPLVGLDAAGHARFALAHADARNPHGATPGLVAARGVRVRETAREVAADAMCLADFLAQLRPILGSSRDHGLTQPAGKRVFVDYRAVSLRPAVGASGANAAADSRRNAAARLDDARAQVERATTDRSARAPAAEDTP